MADKNVYNELSYSADSRLWFVGKQGIQDIMTDLIGLADQFVPKLRDLSDVAALLVKSDVPFYKNFYKSK